MLVAVETYAIIFHRVIVDRGTGLFTEGVGKVHMMAQLALKEKQAVQIGSG